ncbi:hypothetical protein [Streptomyces sp. YIM 98790]|uniref:hypothetical protein n=1 Tax=Streptomyces sp. YIM 98790 TaxID=2689077 RepID=UPI0028BE095B|nr:hypothetical protein [Streptomyces sp. YIM 98790]
MVAFAAGMGPRGRDGIIALVQESLQQPATAERPVTILLGAPGSGASETHTALVEEFGAEHPFAYLNLGRQRSLLPRYALALIALQLERHLPRYRRTALPRLRLGLLASDQELPMASLADGRRSIQQVLGEFQQQAEARHQGNYLAAFLEVAGGAIGAPDGASAVVVALMDSLRRSRRRGPGHRFLGHAPWYGEHSLTHSHDRWEALVELNRWRHIGDRQDQRRLDRILFSAFLEDLRRHAGGAFRPSSFLLLLDNADTDDGLRFLDLLLRARHEDAVSPGGRCDPLTVVVSAHRWLPRWGPVTGDQWPWRLREPGQVSLADWRSHRPARDAEDTWWYPVRLRDLRESEVRVRFEQAIRTSPGLVPFLHLAPFVHRLTHGLPRAVQQVLGILARHDVPTVAGPEQDIWLRSLPDRTLPAAEQDTEHDTGHDPEPGGAEPGGAESGRAYSAQEPKLVDLALRQLLRGFTAEETAQLAECAAARDLSGALRVRSLSAELFGKLRSCWLLEPPPWPAPGASPGAPPEPGRAAAPPRLHPWLRRLLLWRLARRPDDWTTVHELLADFFRSERDREQEMYHRLAAGQLGTVTEHLVRRFRETGAAGWVAEYDGITAAPNPFPPSLAPRTVFAGLLERRPESPAAGGSATEPAVTLTTVVRGLVAARWVWSDPLGDPRGQLDQTLAEGFGQLALLSGGQDVVVLLDEAERYRHWRRTPAGGV